MDLSAVPVFSRTTDLVQILDHRLGSGSQGICQKVYFKRIGVCVMKTPATVTANEIILQRREIAATAMLNNHPNIISFFGIVYTHDKEVPTGFLMEYMEGGSMTDYLAHHPEIPFELKRKWARQIVLAVQYMHSRGIMHRDLNTNNILINSSQDPQKVKVADFGYAREANDYLILSKNRGTICFAAPEIIEQCNYTKAVDIFSLGMTLYAIFMQRIPFHPEAFLNWTTEYYKQRLLGQIPGLPSRPILDANLGAIGNIIQMCWATNPDDRPDIDMVCDMMTEAYGIAE